MKNAQYVIPAFLFLGIAVGILFGRPEIGTFLGLGLGLGLYLVINTKYNNKDNVK
ncbi:hypothetical protein [Staphylococcus chromogenes]|uniref:hypothetical protein n=1 Tax=Staphylococcus chromogenes TaxID=46126 RepID=UPI0028871B83|nr:hypothetical protein [Staphylococcus chromogenes]MDT0716848.1 hypothetical protein [Staphylococcus chromogenes]MDT0736831.1 hypothetical protein [Staphylococcus chromogenes]MDT0750909.1 hypothetical protein [Staphylococcus chromogenes]